MIPRRAVPPFAVLVLVACVLAGCSPKSPVVQNSGLSRQHMTQAELGAEMQQKGLMSQKDYIRIGDLEIKTSETHQISEEDFAWTLSLLKTANNSLTRARAMATLWYIHPMSSAQKSQATSAIAPYLNSKDALDQSSAKRVQTAIQKN